MTHYTVVISDGAAHDTGFRGTSTFWSLATRFGSYAELGLYWFLCSYYGRSQVSLLRPSQLLRMRSKHKTDWLFVGLPTQVSEEHLKKVEFRHLVLYDSNDRLGRKVSKCGVNFGRSDQSFLLSQTNICLKTWRDDRINYPCKIGLLPIKRPPWNNKLHVAERWRGAKHRLGLQAGKVFDVGFVARPTGDLKKNQRVRWLVDLKRERPDLTLWGGLVGGRRWREYVDQTDALDRELLQPCWLDCRKVGFFQYFTGLKRSKVALAPAGYAPWSYRHFEAIYARSIVVSNDLSHYEFLIPFPRDGMVEVPDGESVVGGIEEALEMQEKQPDLAERNVQQLDRWLDQGLYSRRRPQTLARFWAQINCN